MNQGNRPEQGVFTRDNDLSRIAKIRREIESMVDGLNGHEIIGMRSFFPGKFCSLRNAGCGRKHILREFLANGSRPFQAVFSEKVYVDEARRGECERLTALGSPKAIHSREFMGVAPTGKPVEFRNLHFGKVVERKIAGNKVMVDFLYVMQKLGISIFNDQCWDAFDRGERVQPCLVGK